MIHRGILRREQIPFSVRELTGDDLPAVQEVQESAVSILEQKDTLQSLSEEELVYILNGNGIMIGAFVEEQLIAFRALLVPPIDDEHLGLYIGLEEELEQIVYQEITVVHPTYRGNQLQQKLSYYIMQEWNRKHHHFTYVCATVAPHNIPSLKDKLHQGMLIGALTEIYEGKLRFIFYRKLKTDLSPKWEESQEVGLTDISAQKALLQKGWIGFRLKQTDGSFWMLYGKPAKINERK